MKRIITIGELLIDFIPNEKGLAIKNVNQFIKLPGGAPANVAAAVSKLGGNASFIGQVGNDGFGDFLIDTMKNEGVDTSYLFQHKTARTALAFVTLTKEGERDFAFYRNPSADQLLTPLQLPHDIYQDSIIHFCSLSLDNYPLRDTLDQVIQEAKQQNALISFDPNLRLSLFSDHTFYKDIINTYLVYADILKVSDDELLFITGTNKIEEALAYFFSLGIRYVILTQGKKGAVLYKRDESIHADGYLVNVEDTTGAGDSFIGAFLYQVAQHDEIDTIKNEQFYEILKFSNAAAALTTTKFGAISALPTHKEVINFIKSSWDIKEEVTWLVLLM